MPAPAPRKKRLVRAGLLAAAAGYFAFVLLFELPLLPFSSSPSSSSSLPIPYPRRRELEAAAAFASPFSPARPSKPAFPASAPSPSGAARRLPIFSSLLLLPRPNATATPFDATAADAFAAARPHLAHLQALAQAPASTPSSASASAPPPAAPTCPPSVSVHREQLPYDGVRVVELPCGLAVGSHVTVVARPRPARPEYDPKIAERKDGEAAVMVSQFMVELIGTKAVDGEAPPRILHFNPRIRGDYSRRPVIEMNSCYRMQWGQSQRCEGFASRPAEDTGELSSTPEPISIELQICRVNFWFGCFV
ncbi:unnamed protein product [Urochloa humidicola]